MNTQDFMLILFSALMHASWNFLTKRTHAHKITVLWFGFLAAGIITLPLVLISLDPYHISTSWIPYILITSILHAYYLYYLGISYSIGDISLTYPMSRGIGIFCTILIMLAFGIESINMQGAIGIFFLICGIFYLSIKNLKILEKRKAVIVSAKVGVFISMYTIVDKLSIEIIPPTFYLSSMFVLTGIILIPTMLLKFPEHVKSVLKHHKTYSCTVGMASIFTYSLVLFAMKTTQASYVVALREISIVFGSILGFWILKEEVTYRKIIGILMIMIGAYVIKAS